MSDDIKLSVGTKVHVSANVPATYDMAGFGNLNFTEIGEVENLGEFGGTAEVTNFIPLATGIVKKRKGSIDYGEAAMQIGQLAGNAGQAILKEGFDGANRNQVHSFKVEDQDGRIAYFTGVISSFVSVYNDANAVTMVNCNVNLDNRVISDVYDELFTVQYLAGANGSIIGPASQTVASGEDTQPVFANADEGFVFSHWSDTNEDNPRNDTNVTSNLEVTAVFTAES